MRKPGFQILGSEIANLQGAIVMINAQLFPILGEACAQQRTYIYVLWRKTKEWRNKCQSPKNVINTIHKSHEFVMLVNIWGSMRDWFHRLLRNVMSPINHIRPWHWQINGARSINSCFIDRIGNYRVINDAVSCVNLWKY